MLSRARPLDVLLLVLGVLAIIAGLALTTATKLGVKGTPLIALGIFVAVATSLPRLMRSVSEAVHHWGDQGDRLAAIGELGPLVDVDPFEIGVFPSELAERAQSPAPISGTRKPGFRALPPYVARKNVDDALREALTDRSLRSTGRLVVLRGDPKSGKSRTLWEALRTLPDRRLLLAVREPDISVDSSEPGANPLKALVSLDKRVVARKGLNLVIWIDDAQAHLQRGLTRDNLRRLAEIYPAAVIALTIHSDALDALRDFDKPLHNLLRKPFDPLILEPVFSSEELRSAKDAYPALAEDEELVRLPELFASVNILRERYRSHTFDQPFGVAVARAAIDWQRAGMWPGTIDEPTLRELSELTLREIAPTKILDDVTFKMGLTWSTEAVAASAALVSRDPVSDGRVQRFRAFDAIVSWARSSEPPLPITTWDFVLEHTDDSAWITVGSAAYEQNETGNVIRALTRAMGSEQHRTAAAARYLLGLTHGERGESDQAVALLDEVVRLYGDAADPELRTVAADALLSKAKELQGSQEEVAVYGELARRYGDTTDPQLQNHVASALFNKGLALRGSREAILAYDELVRRYGDALDLGLRRTAAIALCNKGLELDNSEEAIVAYDEVIRRYGDDTDLNLRLAVAKALVNKGFSLAEVGRWREALDASHEVIRRFGGAKESELSEEVTSTRNNAVVLIRQHPSE